MIITYPIILIFVFLVSFLLHELMHIKGQGVKNTGIINVEEFGMTCGADYAINGTWFKLSGGILTSIIMFIMCLCSSGFWQWSFLTFGLVHLCYGIYEGFAKENIPWQRYLIYFGIILLMLSIYILKGVS